LAKRFSEDAGFSRSRFHDINCACIGFVIDSYPVGYKRSRPAGERRDRTGRYVMHMEEPMARYDYRCTSCDTTFEVEHHMGEHPEITCPKCGSKAEQVFSTSGIVFSGSGFYNTDQRDKK
jgi:putative FmdB family regulatory protein